MSSRRLVGRQPGGQSTGDVTGTSRGRQYIEFDSQSRNDSHRSARSAQRPDRVQR